MCACVHACVRACVRACVCVCVCERERERESLEEDQKRAVKEKERGEVNRISFFILLFSLVIDTLSDCLIDKNCSLCLSN